MPASTGTVTLVALSIYATGGTGTGAAIAAAYTTTVGGISVTLAGYDIATGQATKWDYIEVVLALPGATLGVVKLGRMTSSWGKNIGNIQRWGKSLGDARRFFYDNRKFSAISRAYWTPRGPANGRSLHHWLIPQRATWVPQGVRNAGFNLIELPAFRGVFHPTLPLNQWMGFARNWRGTHRLKAVVVENTMRTAIPGSIAGGGYLGWKVGDYFWGTED